MSATTTPITFVDLYTDLLNRMRTTLGTAAASTSNTNYAKRYVNEGLHDLHIHRSWPWAERRTVITTTPIYSEGTVTVASVSRTAVTGSGSFFDDRISGFADKYRATQYGKITFTADSTIYVISGVTSNTAMTLSDPIIVNPATTSANVLASEPYQAFMDDYPLASDFWRLIDARVTQTTGAVPLDVISGPEFFRRFPRTIAATGTPTTCAVLEIGPASTTTLQPRIIFYPVPDSTYSIAYRYITTNLALSSAGVGAANLSADTDEPIVPLRYRHVIVAYAVWQWYRDLKDDQRAEPAHAAYIDLVKRMEQDSFPYRPIDEESERHPYRAIRKEMGEGEMPINIRSIRNIIEPQG